MKKISEMYRLSGGTDYRHTCLECRNCRKVKKSRYRCQLYEEAGGAGDWKAHNIACRFFDMLHLPEHLRIESEPDNRQQVCQDDDWVQLTIEDFPECMPDDWRNENDERVDQ